MKLKMDKAEQIECLMLVIRNIAIENNMNIGIIMLDFIDIMKTVIIEDKENEQ